MLGFTASPFHDESENGVRIEVSRPFVWLTVIVNAIFWMVQLGVDLRYTGLFYFLGVDWSRFWGASRAFLLSGPSAAYSLAAIGHFMSELTSYYGSGSSFGLMVQSSRVGPVPYPPIFLYFFVPFTLQPPMVGFIAWTVLNAAVAGWIFWKLTARLSPEVRWVVMEMLLLFYPFIIELYVGQLTVLLLAGLYLGYRDFQRGCEFRAGLWLGALLFKPQFAVVPLLVLLFKRRWLPVAGAASTGVAIVLSSLIVAGFNGVWDYVKMIVLHYPGYAGGLAIDPHSMITWRGLIFDIAPNIGSFEGVLLTGLLSIISLIPLIPIWAGEWDPTSPHFHTQMLATMMVAQLVAYHAHLHGALLLTVPAVLMVVEGEASRVMQWLMGAALLGPHSRRDCQYSSSAICV
ncbi:MAG: glycosyltransferase family 87 protein [Nitrolancea sp.]